MAGSDSEDDYLFEVLTEEDIRVQMAELVKEVAAILALPKNTTRTLLTHFRWNKERLLERYYDGDENQLFRQANIIKPSPSTGDGDSESENGDSLSRSSSDNSMKNSKSSISGKSQSTGSTNDNVECDICLNKVPTAKMTGLDCGHLFCVDCWREYLTRRIMDEGMGPNIKCADWQCEIVVDEKLILKLLKDKKARERYRYITVSNFVECNRLMKWCPAPDCKNAVRAQYVKMAPVKCSCGFQFCFNCGETWHDPVNCRLLKRWLIKAQSDCATSNWLASNTKECPKCEVTIEKDGGCNHMVCRNQNCRAEFCWVCLGPWEPHGTAWYNCNRYDDAEARQARDTEENRRADMKRFLFYCNRYMNHWQSLKFENRLYDSVRRKMEEMQQHGMSWVEVQFLKKAVDVLCRCRQTLMYTYVFAYYLTSSNQQLLFEANQKDLEIATETLSEYLERDITTEMLMDIKQRVQDKMRYCENRVRKLTDHVHEGYENDWWKYNDGPQTNAQFS